MLVNLSCKPKLKIDLRSIYFQRNYTHAEKSHLKNPNWYQLAQGILVNYSIDKSPFGLDVSLQEAITIKGKNPTGAGGNQLLHTKNNGSTYSATYGKIGNLTLKATLLDTAYQTTKVNFGFISANSAFTHHCHDRLFPTTYRGIQVENHWQNIKIYGLYLDRTQFSTGTGFKPFINGQGKKISKIAIAGINYSILSSHSSLNLNAETGKSTKYLQGYFGQLTYKHNLQQLTDFWLINMQLRYSQKAGSNWDAGKRPLGSSWCWRCLPVAKISNLGSNTGNGWFDNRAYNFNLNLQTVLASWQLSCSFTHTQANSQGTGANSNKFHYTLVGNDCSMGTFWTARQISSFNYHEENAYQGSIYYHFYGQLQGLTAGIVHTYGNNIHRKTGLANEQETDLVVQYIMQTSWLKGLSFTIKYANYLSREYSQNIYGTRGYRLNDFRSYIEYSFTI